jgi:uncharacterized protein
MAREVAIALAAILSASCAGAPRSPSKRAASPPSPRGAASAPMVAWADLSPATFARAKAERKFIVLDGAAEWCHWCHVMDAETYHDPAVVRLLGDKFIAVKVDIDARPDVEERYAAWGWPATVVFSPDGDELGKYRGYLAPDEMLEILRTVVNGGAKSPGDADDEPKDAPPIEPLSKETLAWIRRWAPLELEDHWDPKEGGWGIQPKVPLGWNVMWALGRAKAGDVTMREHALFVLDRERRIVDPVWGGIYQYSVAPDWDHPHFEKLMIYNAGALESFVTGWALTNDGRHLETARSIRRWFEGFLLSPEGAFYASQDADLNAHEPGKTFVEGERYFALDDRHRRALGVPRVDRHEYARENGLAIGAYATFVEVTKDKGAEAIAVRAATRILATHTTKGGGVAHEANPEARLLHLGDNAAFGWGLIRLFEATGDRKLLAPAQRIANAILDSLEDKKGGGFFAHTADDAAVGVFQKRRKPFDDNVLAIRFLARLARAVAVKGDDRTTTAVRRALASVATPERIRSRGKFIGDFLSALDETKDLW